MYKVNTMLASLKCTSVTSSFRRTLARMAFIAPVVVIAACNSTNGTKTSSTSSGSGSAAAATDQKQQISGQVAVGAFAVGAKVQVFDAKGKDCGSTSTDAQGRFALTTVPCTAPYLVAAEAVKSEGLSLFALVPGSDMATSLLVTPISSAIAALTLGDVPSSTAFIAKSGKLATLVTVDRLRASEVKMREMLLPLLQASSADKADLLRGSLNKAQGLDAVMDAATIIVDADGGLGQFQIRLNVPSLYKPVLLRNAIGSDVAKALFDPAHGQLPSELDPAEIAKMAGDKAEITDFFSALMKYSGAERQAYRDLCFLHNGSGEATGGVFSDFYQQANVRIIKYNAYTDFDNEALPQLNTGAGTLAYVAADLKTKGGRTDRVYFWLVKGSQAVRDCSSTGGKWRILGNQRKLHVDLESYALKKTEYNAAFLQPELTYGSGIAFHVNDPAAIGVTHVVVTGPSLPTEGVILLNTSYGFLRYHGGLPSLYEAAKSASFNPDSVVDYFDGIALNDAQIAPVSGLSGDGITDQMYDPHNSYVFRVFTGLRAQANAYTYTLVLPKRPYLSKEFTNTTFPIVALNMSQFLASFTQATPVHIEFNSPNDIRGIPVNPVAAWIQREGLKSTPNCPATKPDCGVTIQKPFHEFLTPGSNVDLDAGQASADLFPTTVEGEASIGTLRFRSADSFGRPIEVQLAINLKR